jgi:hypothetical protein
LFNNGNLCNRCGNLCNRCGIIGLVPGDPAVEKTRFTGPTQEGQGVLCQEPDPTGRGGWSLARPQPPRPPETLSKQSRSIPANTWSKSVLPYAAADGLSSTSMSRASRSMAASPLSRGWSSPSSAPRPQLDREAPRGRTGQVRLSGYHSRRPVRPSAYTFRTPPSLDISPE